MSRLSTTTPQPSPRTNPSAAASKAWHCPVGDSASAWSKLRVTAGDSSRFTPAASASSESPARRLWHARWMATSDDEQAVSIVTDGPRRSRKYDTRLAMMLSAPPVAVPRVDLAQIGRRDRYAVLADAGADEHAGLRVGAASRPECPHAPAPPRPPRAAAAAAGSILSASRGDDLEELRVERVDVAQERAPPGGARQRRGTLPGEPSSNGSQRSAGTSPTAGPALGEELPQRVRASMLRSPPGNRQPRPMTAIGSSSDDRPARDRLGVDRVRPRRRSETCASALMVGFCQNSTGDTGPAQQLRQVHRSARPRRGSPRPDRSAVRRGSISSGPQPMLVTR